MTCFALVCLKACTQLKFEVLPTANLTAASGSTPLPPALSPFLTQHLGSLGLLGELREIPNFYGV